MENIKLYKINYENKTIPEWAKFYKINVITVYSRIREGWSYIDAITKPVNRSILDFTKKYGKLKIIEQSGKNKDNKKLYKCLCDCGNYTYVRAYYLYKNKTKSCGCLEELNRKTIGERSKSHGKTKTKVYNSWQSMKFRCYNKNNEYYKYYGGRGIKVCKSWLKFENFYKDMGEPPSNDHSLDRIDFNKNYCKRNCRWATKIEQANNTRAVIKITYNNKTMSIAQWSRFLNLKDKVLRRRLKRNWSIEKAFYTPYKGK